MWPWGKKEEGSCSGESVSEAGVEREKDGGVRTAPGQGRWIGREGLVTGGYTAFLKPEGPVCLAEAGGWSNSPARESEAVRLVAAGDPC